MRLIAALVIGVSMLVAASVGAVHFDEFGGVVPKDNKTARCEFKAAGQVGKAIKGFTKCHIKRALGRLADDTAEDACEKGVADTYNKNVRGAGCPDCIGSTTGETLEFIVDSQAGKVYCAGTTPLGADDDGARVPPDKATGRCETAVARKVVKLSNAYINCHVAAARSAIKRKITADEDTDTACETAARSSFRATKTSGCSCIDLADIATSVDLQFGEIGGVERIFCASPSGAFVGGAFD